MTDEINYLGVAKDCVEELLNPDFVKVEPDLIGRIEGTDHDDADARAETRCVASESVGFSGAAIGCVTVQAFKSTDVQDRGGYVFRITTGNDASAFLPHAVVIKNGVEVHIAGDAEAEAFVAAWAKIGRALKKTGRARGQRTPPQEHEVQREIAHAGRGTP